jgi:hypothetical protein
VLRTIGRRSRAYRQSHAARQGVLALGCAVAAAATGHALLAYAARFPARGSWPLSMGQVLVNVSAFMVVVGLLYLVVNAWWIRTALLRPPPRLREIVSEGRREGSGEG